MNYEELLGTTRNYEVGVENPTTDELSDAAVEPANPARSGGASLGGELLGSDLWRARGGGTR